MIVYKVYNKLTKRVYIGKTTQTLDERKKQHLKDAYSLKNKCVFHNELKKYANEVWIWQILDIAKSSFNLDQKERKYIKHFAEKSLIYNEKINYKEKLENENEIKNYQKIKIRKEFVKPKPKSIKTLCLMKRYGGKKRLAKKIIPIIENMGFDNNKHTFIEPFSGVFSVCLNLNPKKAILNDVERGIIEFCKVIQNDKDYKKFKKELNKIVNRETLDKEYYYLLRKIHNEKLTHSAMRIKKAAYYLILIKACFGGNFNENNYGEINPRYASPEKKISIQRITQKNCFKKYAEKYIKELDYIREYTNFKNWKFIVDDYRNVIDNHNNTNTFWYIDPPYDSSVNRKNEKNFSQKYLLDKISKIKGKWIQTNKYTNFIKENYENIADFDFFEKHNSVDNKNGGAYYKEVIITKKECLTKNKTYDKLNIRERYENIWNIDNIFRGEKNGK